MNQRIELPPIPFIDVAAQRRRLGTAIDEAIARVLGHCQFILGPEVAAFEAELAAFCGARHAVTCASGTDALVLALRAKNVGPGDAVFCPSFTFCATAEVAALVGATPVFVDVKADSFNIDPKGLPPRSLPRAVSASRRKPSSRSICSGCRPITKPWRRSPRPRTCSCSTMPRRPSAPPSAAASSALSPP